MRNRAKTIEGLRAMAERPGTPNEGEIARMLLERFGVKEWVPLPFVPSKFPRGAVVWYCYWSYRNERGVIACDAPKWIQGQHSMWMRIKFDRLKQPRWVPVTSPLGCHIDTEPLREEETLYRMTLDWERQDAELAAKLAAIYQAVHLKGGKP